MDKVAHKDYNKNLMLRICDVNGNLNNMFLVFNIMGIL
jgi:hypothetical protein